MVQVNTHTPIEIAALSAKLHTIFKRRAERVIFVEADPEVSFQEFADLVGIVQPMVGLVSWVAPEVAERVRVTHCLVPGCGACTNRGPIQPWFTGVRVE
jgi:hypothetical protein